MRHDEMSPMKWHRIMALRSQAEIAEMVGASRQTISTTENGHTVPSVTLALAIAAALGTTVERLWGSPPVNGG